MNTIEKEMVSAMASFVVNDGVNCSSFVKLNDLERVAEDFVRAGISCDMVPADILERSSTFEKVKQEREAEKKRLAEIERKEQDEKLRRELFDLFAEEERIEGRTSKDNDELLKHYCHLVWNKFNACKRTSGIADIAASMLPESAVGAVVDRLEYLQRHDRGKIAG